MKKILYVIVCSVPGQSFNQISPIEKVYPYMQMHTICFPTVTCWERVNLSSDSSLGAKEEGILMHLLHGKQCTM